MGAHAHDVHQPPPVLLPETHTRQKHGCAGNSDNHRRQEGTQVLLDGEGRHADRAGNPHHEGIDDDDGQGTAGHAHAGGKPHEKHVPEADTANVLQAEMENTVLVKII